MAGKFERFTVLIASINRSIKKIKAGEMSELNLKGTHVSCLYYLYISGEMTAKELADMCDEDKGAISRSVDFLEKEGYVTVNSKTAKRYKSPIRLTEKGMRSAAVVAGRVDSIVEAAGGWMTEEEREKFYFTLDRLDGALRDISESYKSEETEEER